MVKALGRRHSFSSTNHCDMWDQKPSGTGRDHPTVTPQEANTYHTRVAQGSLANLSKAGTLVTLKDGTCPPPLSFLRWHHLREPVTSQNWSRTTWFQLGPRRQKMQPATSHTPGRRQWLANGELLSQVNSANPQHPLAVGMMQACVDQRSHLPLLGTRQTQNVFSK